MKTNKTNAKRTSILEILSPDSLNIGAYARQWQQDCKETYIKQYGEENIDSWYNRLNKVSKLRKELIATVDLLGPEKLKDQLLIIKNLLELKPVDLKQVILLELSVTFMIDTILGNPVEFITKEFSGTPAEITNKLKALRMGKISTHNYNILSLLFKCEFTERDAYIKSLILLIELQYKYVIKLMVVNIHDQSYYKETIGMCTWVPTTTQGVTILVNRIEASNQFKEINESFDKIMETQLPETNAGYADPVTNEVIEVPLTDDEETELVPTQEEKTEVLQAFVKMLGVN